MTIAQKIFKATFDFLVYLTQLTGWSYTEINVLVWYFLIPASWAILLDRVLGVSFFKTTFGLIAFKVLSSVDLSVFADWLFMRSARFLNSFRGAGSDYVMTSVIVCVLIPLAVYALLLWFALMRSLFSLVVELPAKPGNRL